LRGCPSLVGGRPAKSVVERPRGFESHTPRQLNPIYALHRGRVAKWGKLPWKNRKILGYSRLLPIVAKE
jgi:hypothetical protein